MKKKVFAVMMGIVFCMALFTGCGKAAEETQSNVPETTDEISDREPDTVDEVSDRRSDTADEVSDSEPEITDGSGRRCGGCQYPGRFSERPDFHGACLPDEPV